MGESGDGLNLSVTQERTITTAIRFLFLPIITNKLRLMFKELSDITKTKKPCEMTIGLAKITFFCLVVYIYKKRDHRNHPGAKKIK